MLSAIAIKSLSGRRGTALIGALLPPYQLITARSIGSTSVEATTTSGLSCFRDSSFSVWVEMFTCDSVDMCALAYFVGGRSPRNTIAKSFANC